MRRLGAVATSEARLEMGIGDKATVDADVLFGHSSDREPALETNHNASLDATDLHGSSTPAIKRDQTRLIPCAIH